MSVIDAQLRDELLTRAERDQQARHAGDVDAMQRVDAENLAFLRPVIERHDWLHSGLVGDDGAHACRSHLGCGPCATRTPSTPFARRWGCYLLTPTSLRPCGDRRNSHNWA